MENKKIKLGFDKLIEPYKDGGMPNDPVDVTIGNICSKLMVQYGIPAEIVGGSLYLVMDHIANKGLVFDGNGKYGSKGAELFSCIKAQCVDLTEKKSEQDALNEILSHNPCFRHCRYRMKRIERQTRWARFKNFFNEPKESYTFCLFMILIGSVLGAAGWLYITG